MDFYRPERRVRPIPLTALIDIFFLLVIFFLLATSFVRIQAMELGLPGSGGGNASGATLPLRIDVASDGGVYWRHELVLPTTLRAKLDEEMRRDPDRKLLVRSGKGVSVQKLVSVLDAAYLAGVKNVSVDKWDESDLPVAEDTEEGALEKALEEEEKHTPVLDEKTLEALPRGPYSAEEQFDLMLENAP